MQTFLDIIAIIGIIVWVIFMATSKGPRINDEDLDRVSKGGPDHH